MKNLIKGLLVSVSSVPPAYIAFFTIGWLYTLVLNVVIEGPPVGYFLYYRLILWKLFLASLVFGAGLVVAAMVHVVVTDRLDAEAKGLWLLLLLLGNIVVVPFYCCLNILRKSPFRLQGPPNKSLDRSHGQRVSHHHWSGAAAR